MTTRHQPTAAVRESFGQAQQQAAAMVAGPPTPWNEATRAPRGSARWLGIAAVSIAAAGIGGWLAADWLSAAGRTVPAVPPRADEPIVAAPAAPSPAVGPATAVAVPSAPPTALKVTRQAGLIRIEASHAALADVVRALAQATHTSVQGSEALAAITTPVTLQWQGTEVAAAWDALLGRHASIGVSCSGTGCDLWIVGITPPSRAAAPAASAVPGMAVAATDQAASPEIAQPPRPAPRAEPPPASDENTETN